MKTTFRVDASVQIGSGHVMRCLALADALTQKGAEVSFISRELSGNLCDFVEGKGYPVYRMHSMQVAADNVKQCGSRHSDWLDVSWEIDAKQTATILGSKKDADWLVVDHYALDGRWEKIVRTHVKKIMAIDDLADRIHDCDILLDQNLYNDMETRYDSFLPEHCRRLLGPAYALLRSEFAMARKSLRKRNGSVHRILIFFGGSDPTNETRKALEAVTRLNLPDIAVDVVVGIVNPYKDQIKQLCATMPNTEFYCQVENMAELMVKADLAIGAGGSTTWERCCLGLPGLVCSFAENQEALTRNAEAKHVLAYLGHCSAVSQYTLAKSIHQLCNNSELLRSMSLHGMQLVDGAGVGRVVTEIEALLS